MNTYIFLGPSLESARAKELLDAIYLPPVQQGDVLRILAQRPAAIGIIDGFFELVPAVWHKEILLALAEGVHVFGAASMGALRAAELHTFGMKGVGKVFEGYRDGLLTGDDEVALAHQPEETGYRKVSEAMVDIRDACEAAVVEGILSPGLGDRLVAIGKSMFFADRSYEAVARRAADEGQDAVSLRQWLDFVGHRGPGLKERDAAALLCEIREFLAASPGPFRANFEVEKTEFLDRFRNEVELTLVSRRQHPPMHEDEMLRGGRTVYELRKEQLLRILARQDAERLGWQLTGEEVDEKAARFRERYELSDPEKMSAWMRAEGLTETAFWQSINDACLIDRLERLHGHQIECGLADQLRMATARLQATNTPQEEDLRFEI
jgi:hypothetical protein